MNLQLSWHNNYSVNIIDIDKEHKWLFDEIEKFQTAIGKKTSHEILGEILKSLKSYSTCHFNTEEELMLKYNYPHYKEHVAQHQFFISVIEKIRQRFENGKMVLVIELICFLKEWLKQHIEMADKAYSHFFNECGIH
ncbi:MAG: bacteriohemerythrin [Bacteroidales bacterium]